MVFNSRRCSTSLGQHSLCDQNQWQIFSSCITFGFSNHYDDIDPKTCSKNWTELQSSFSKPVSVYFSSSKKCKYRSTCSDVRGYVDILNREIIRLFRVIIVVLTGNFVNNIVGLRTSVFSRRVVSAWCFIPKKIKSYPLAATNHQLKANIAIKAATQIA